MKKVIKIFGKVLLVSMILFVLFISFIYANNKLSLKREAKLIKHQGEYVNVDGKNMNIYVTGNKDSDKTLVFMAGGGTPAVIYDFKPLYSQLSDKYKIVVIEKFGYGYSDNMESERSITTMLRQDREALQKAGLEGPYILCPHSASGLEAVSWAANYPDEIEAIIGLDMAVPEQFDYQMGNLDDLEERSYKESIKDDDFYNFVMFDMGVYRLLSFSKIFPASVSDKLTKEEQKEYKAITYRWYSQYYKTSGYWETAVLTKEQIDAYKELRNVKIPNIPTLMFLSDGESAGMMVGGKEIWKKIHENYVSGLTNAKLIELDCNHYVHVEKAEEVSKNIIDFIDNNL